MRERTVEYTKRAIFNTYARNPVVFTRGKGTRLFDEDGNEYIDMLAGIAVCNLGHSHPRLIDVLNRQAEILWHVSNLFFTEPQAELARELTGLCFADRVFFCNSGAEANEAAIKIARRYFYSVEKSNRYKILTMENSFHGRTMATLSATGQQKVKKGYHPLLEGFVTVPFNDISALESEADDKTCAVMLEPIQGEGGVLSADPGYLRDVRELCDKRGILLIFDEVQTGMGRTGRLFAHEHYGVVPDIMTLAKAIANGLPMGAMLATEGVAAAFDPGSHASTFGGTPIVSAVALEVIRTIQREGLVKRAAEIGEYFKTRLSELKERFEQIKEVRGAGLLLGVVLSCPAGPVADECLKKGFVVNCVQNNVIRLAPPLVIEKDEIDLFVDALGGILSAF